MRQPLALALTASIVFTASACGVKVSPTSGGAGSVILTATSIKPVQNLGLVAGLTAERILDGLNNPAGLAFASDGRLAICSAGTGRENGNGIVQIWQDGSVGDYITAFPTEYWKVGKDGAPDRFKVGPLGAAWLDDGRLAVSNAGLGDGAETILFFDGSGTAADGSASNSVGPTSDDAADKGEGNLTGFSVSPGGARIFVCGQGADAKTWVLTCDVEELELATFASADDHGIAINSPMQTLPWDDDTILVLYSGAGGVEDGLIVQWNADGTPKAQWTLPRLADPMGMARIPGTSDLAVVDNNWNLERVQSGQLGRVSLAPGGGEARVKILAHALRGPVSCTFGPDGRLYVAQLGPEFDADKGNVVAISGIQ
ncbi:hypothetical protein [Engelhardtia mirabilis]|uniref:Uncharacterized protein n=1 Tax=Engelhardtia mirabilis TaxID=2528011 RepID=A0A518BFW6_9BACT|nr:hypothetical protein Pla133_09370 [Planctomycetes bacterium Pla133]QDV00197.1 hypothetical protein Pla86_09360 [Planctomycetes bacterium Pla86]